MKILFIVYQFPPLNVGGALRPAYFVKYLKRFGIEPIVITLDPNDYNIVYDKHNIDKGLLSIIDGCDVRYAPSKNIVNHRSNRFSKFLSIYFNIYRGSEGKYWKKGLFNTITEIISKESISGILVTAPPFSILPLSVELKHKFNIPLIVDMRDAWSLWISNPYSNYFNYYLTKRKENNILQNADGVIATSKQTIKDFLNLHPTLKASKFHYIPNGFDANIGQNSVKYLPKEEKIIIGYVGSFYYTPESRDAIMNPFWKKRGHRIFQYVPRKEDWLYRSPYFFFKSIAILISKYPKYKSRIEIHFAGLNPDWLKKMVIESGLKENIKNMGFLTHEEVIDFQSKCDFLLMTSSKVINGKDYSVAGKTFEYFSTGKPIIAFVNEGEQKDVLINSNASVICNPDDHENNSELLHQIFSNGIELKMNVNYLETFKRYNLTEKLAHVLKKIIKESII